MIGDGSRPTVLVTGATGFVGGALTDRLRKEGYAVRGVTRRPLTDDLPFQVVPVKSLDGATDWGTTLEGVDTVLHLAARTHATAERGGGRLDDYRPVNVDGTRRLAEAAIRAGVRRFILLSSIKVNGECTTDAPFTSKDVPDPQDAYGITKWEAERALAQLTSNSALETVVVRSPLVYGPGVKANFARLLGWVRRGLPLPFGAVDNRRSLVALPNLVDLLVHCLHAAPAAGKTFLVSDGEDVSTPELVRRIATAMERPVRLLSVPPGALRLAGRAVGRVSEVDRLCGSLQVDMEETRRVLRWDPPITMNMALQEMVKEARWDQEAPHGR